MSTRASSVRYLIQESILFLASCFLLFFANTWRTLADYDLIRTGVSAIAVVSAGWLAINIRRRSGRPAPLAVPLTIFLIAYLITALTSIDPRRSLDEVWVTAMYGFVFWLTAQLAASGWPRELFVKALLTAGALLAGLAWYIFLNWYSRWLSVAPGVWLPEIAFRLPLANGTATFIYLLTLSAIARFVFTSARIPRILLAVWIVSALGLLYLTASRGGWLATAFGLLTIVLVSIRDRGGVGYLRALWEKARQRWQLSFIMIVLGLVALAVAGRLASRQIINPEKTTAGNARTEYWVPAWDVFLQNPIVGQGPLTFGSAYLRYNSTPPHGFFAHAHSLYFNLLSETGLIGFVAFGVLAAATFVALWRSANQFGGQDRAVAVGALACAVAWAVHSFVDTVHVEPMNAVLLAVLLGSALAGHETLSRPNEQSTERPTPNRFQSWLPIAIGLLLAATGLYNVWRLAPFHAGISLGVRSQWAEAATQLEEAKRRDPGSAMAHQQSGLVNSILAASGESEALDRAVTDFETVVALDPDWWLNHANLAALYLAKGEPQTALREFREAVKLGPGSPLLQLNYGVAAEAAGQTDEAGQAYSQALTLRPDWGTAYFWRSTPFRAEVLAAWRDVASLQPVKTLAEMEALAAGADRVRDYTPLIEAYLQLGRLDQAELLLSKADLALADMGEDRMELLWLKGELAAARGDLRLASEFGRDTIDGYQMQSAFGAGAFGSAAYGLVFFRREAMAVDLIPQLTLAPLTDKWAARYVTLGDWYAALGDDAAAVAVYQRVLMLVPDNVEAAERLGR
jgi:tetratricopeptide (TPR) repeat protein